MPNETVRNGDNTVIQNFVDTTRPTDVRTVDFTALVTTDPHVVGTPWNNGGVVVISAG